MFSGKKNDDEKIPLLAATVKRSDSRIISRHVSTTGFSNKKLFMSIDKFIAARTDFSTDTDGSFKSKYLLIKRTARQLKAAMDKFSHDRPAFNVNMKIYDEKDKFELARIQDEEDYRKKLALHNTIAETFVREIGAIDELNAQISAEAKIDSLKMMVTYKKYHDEILENLNQKRTAIDNANCCFRIFACCAPDEVVKLSNKVDKLDRQRANLDSESPDQIRQVLLAKLKKEHVEKEKILKEHSLQRPTEKTENRKKFINAQAKIIAAESGYAHQVDNKSMLLMIRIFDLIRQINEAEENASAAEFLETFGVQLGSFYCLDPGRYEFGDYLKKFDELENEDRKLIVAGTASDELIHEVLPGYGSGKGLRMR